jgi:hypothetical protein
MRLPAQFVSSLAHVLCAFLLAAPLSASAQSELCTTRAIGLRPAITATEALRWAKGEVLAGDLDSVLTSMMTTGTVDAEGQSTGWTVQMTSPKRLHVVMFNDGAMTCASHALEKPLMAAPVNENGETIFDLPRLIGIARDALKPPPDLKVLRVSASLQRQADNDTARWWIAFVDAQGYPKGEVTIDSRTGAVVK